MKKQKGMFIRLCLFLFSLVFLTGCGITGQNVLPASSGETSKSDAKKVSYNDYSGEPYQVIQNNQPDFTKEQKGDTTAFETYSRLDALGRCGVAFANICEELMPTEKRGKIGMVKPSGWHTVKYGHVDGKYLYNRCHLIGFLLAGENANEKNLITGTRYMNVEGMLGFENEVAEYVKRTDHHVLYRVTPVFEGDNLLVSGVRMEAYSVEDHGAGVCFHVFVYNVQPGVVIDYKTGESYLAGKDVSGEEKKTRGTQNDQKKAIEKTQEYVINKNTGKFHLPSCSSVKETRPKNRKTFHGSRSTLLERGYTPCERCHP